MKHKKPCEIRSCRKPFSVYRVSGMRDEYYYCKIGANGEYMNHSLPETYPTRQGARKAMIQSINLDLKHNSAIQDIEYAPIPYTEWKKWATDKTLQK